MSKGEEYFAHFSLSFLDPNLTTANLKKLTETSFGMKGFNITGMGSSNVVAGISSNWS